VAKAKATDQTVAKPEAMSGPPAKKQRKRNDIKGTGQGWRKGQLKVTAEQIMTVSKEYFSWCQQQDRKPTFEGLALRLGVCSDTLKSYLGTDGKKDMDTYNPDVVVAIKKVVDYLSDDIQQRNTPMDIFRAKQAHYGGYVDRPDSQAGGQVSISFTFVQNNQSNDQ
jgi:hypothetical protein